jgi:hypothetical protein
MLTFCKRAPGHVQSSFHRGIPGIMEHKRDGHFRALAPASKQQARALKGKGYPGNRVTSQYT